MYVSMWLMEGVLHPVAIHETMERPESDSGRHIRACHQCSDLTVCRHIMDLASDQTHCNCFGHKIELSVSYFLAKD